jgi:lipid-A-disaccharide synthase
MAKYYFIAGEASGDLHAAAVIHEIRKRDTKAEIRAWGGDQMKRAGAHIDKHISKLAFMGFLEVLANLPAIVRNFSLCKKNIIDFQPDAIVLVDYAGFNLRMARFAKKHEIRVYYYIAPKVWAWRKSRIRQLKAYVDRLFVIFPFEKSFFAKHNMQVEYVGNPLVERISKFEKEDDFLAKHHLPDDFVALLPGSRQQELKKIFPVMLSVAKQMPHRFFVVAALQKSKSFFDSIHLPDNVKLLYDTTYGVLSYAHSAVVTSGTATLETAMFDVPQVVVYKGGAISFWIANKVVDRTFLKHISLVNIIAQKEVVKELIQNDFTIGNTIKELRNIFAGKRKRTQILADYSYLVDLLGNEKSSARIVEAILKDFAP